jgi:hypothetical protein
MTTDLSVVGALALLTGLFLTAHLVIVAGLITRRPRWPAVVALLAPPAAPFLAHRAGLHVRAYVWGFAFIAYVAVQLTFRD